MVTEDVPTTCFPGFRSGRLVPPTLHPEAGVGIAIQEREVTFPVSDLPQCSPHLLGSHDSHSRSQRFLCGAPQETTQDYSVEGDRMSGRRKEKTVVTGSKETKTSSLRGMGMQESCRKGACEFKHLKKGRDHQ